MVLAIINTAILPVDGTYRLETITLETAREFAKTGLVSYIGHETTSYLISTDLGVDCPYNRELWNPKPGDKVLVFKLKGRAPEGKRLNEEEMRVMGYEYKVLTRLS